MVNLGRKTSLQQSDPSMALLNQMFSGTFCPMIVVNSDARQVFHLDQIIQHNNRNVLFAKAFDRTPVCLSGYDNAIHVFFYAHFSAGQTHMVICSNKKAIVPFHRFLHDRFQSRRIERIQNGRILIFVDHKRDIIRFLASHCPGDWIRRIIQLICRSVDPGLCSLANRFRRRKCTRNSCF